MKNKCLCGKGAGMFDNNDDQTTNDNAVEPTTDQPVTDVAADTSAPVADAGADASATAVDSPEPAEDVASDASSMPADDSSSETPAGGGSADTSAPASDPVADTSGATDPVSSEPATDGASLDSGDSTAPAPPETPADTSLGGDTSPPDLTPESDSTDSGSPTDGADASGGADSSLGGDSGSADTPSSADSTDSAPSSDDSGLSAVPVASAEDEELLSVKKDALADLSPLIDKLDQTPEENFRTLMMMIQASDDQTMVKRAYDAAKGITDEKERAQALLDVVNEINYFTHAGSNDGSSDKE